MSIENPLVSVLMSTYNRKYLFQRALDSILDQTFSDNYETHSFRRAPLKLAFDRLSGNMTYERY